MNHYRSLTNLLKLDTCKVCYRSPTHHAEPRSCLRMIEVERGRRSLGRAKSRDELDFPQNDDEQEQRRRQRERILEQQRRNLNSPATPQDRHPAQGTGVAGLSNTQLADHYADCIRLSTENKITVKNAFGLHLIDYMSEMIKSKEGTTNFQMASCTLDASTKIYAYRVDCVHAETLKMAGGLGMVDDQNKKKDNRNEMNGVESGGEEIKKRKTKAKSCATIEKNLKNITLNPADLEFEMDPLIQKMTLMYDEGGVSGLLTNNLAYANDYCELLLDPSVFPPPLDPELRKFTTEEKEVEGSKCNITKFAGSLCLVKNSTICPSLASFEFSNCSDLEVDFRCTPNENSEFAYDPNDPRTASPSAMDDDNSRDNEGFPDATMMDNAGQAAISGISEIEARAGCAPTAKENAFGAISLSLRQSLMEMTGMLADQPSEYSYFDQKLVATWAGPTHWKIKPFTKGKELEEGAKPSTRKRIRKVIPKLEINQDVELKVTLSLTKCLLTKVALTRWSTDKVTLPEDIHYDWQRLRTFFIQPNGLKITIVKASSTVIDAGQDDQYNYNNPNDCENFCPSTGDDSSADEMGGGDDVEGGTSGVSFGLNTQEFTAADDLPAGTSQSILPFTGSNLAQQPYKIDKWNIAYERTAKKVDVLKVKKTMWSILSQTVNEHESIAEKMTSPMSFSDLVSVLPKHVTETTAKNVTIPIAFVTLLHLVNEKNLKLCGQEDLTDFIIEQD